MVTELKRIHEEQAVPWRGLSGEVSYATIMRWKGRLESGEELVHKRGPRKAADLDWERLYRLIERLPHGRSRTRGTTRLHRLFMASASRRQIRVLAEQVRSNDLQNMKRIHWNRPGLAWSIDTTEYGMEKWKITPLRDLASHYRFIPLLSEREEGELIARHLEELFEEHEPPLILKRDNGSPFNCRCLDEMLDRHLVLPLNSPPHYPRYNGAMENTNRHIKRRLAKRTGPGPKLHGILATYLELLTHDFNHRVHRLLTGRTPCQVWNNERVRFSRRERQQIFRLLYGDFSRTIGSMSTLNHRVFAAAWRQTVESWLRRQGLISVDEPSTQQKSVNHFSAHFGLIN
jgi:transposase InsO family protein